MDGVFGRRPGKACMRGRKMEGDFQPPQSILDMLLSKIVIETVF